MASDYSRADWNGLHDHLKHVPWKDVFKLSAPAANKFCQWVRVGIDVYINHLKHQVKTHSSPLFSAAYTVAMAHRNRFFHLYLHNKSSASKVKFREEILSKQISNCCKMVLEATKLAFTNKTRVYHFQDTWLPQLLANC